MTCIVAYDIEDNGKRNRLSRFLEGNGLRLQKSVFVVEVERHGFRKFLGQMKRIAGNEGRIAVFRLCAGCMKSAIQSTENEKKVYVF